MRAGDEGREVRVGRGDRRGDRVCLIVAEAQRVAAEHVTLHRLRGVLAAGEGRILSQEVVDVLVHQFAEGVGGGLIRGAFGDGTARTLQHLLGQIQNKVGLGGEVVVDGLIRHTRRSRDVRHRDGVIAALGEEPGRDVGETAAGLPLLLLSTTSGC